MPDDTTGRRQARPWLARCAAVGGVVIAIGLIWLVPDAWRAWSASGVIALMGALLTPAVIRETARAQRSPANADELQDTMDALPDGVVIYDTDTRRVMMNRRFREIHAA